MAVHCTPELIERVYDGETFMRRIARMLENNTTNLTKEDILLEIQAVRRVLDRVEREI